MCSLSVVCDVLVIYCRRISLERRRGEECFFRIEVFGWWLYLKVMVVIEVVLGDFVIIFWLCFWV